MIGCSVSLPAPPGKSASFLTILRSGNFSFTSAIIYQAVLCPNASRWLFAWWSSLIADAPMAGLELYAYSMIRAGFGREAGRKSQSQSLPPFDQVSRAKLVLPLKLRPWTATTLVECTVSGI
jgi:hypothetical protein